MAYTHAYMMKKNLMEIEHMARRTNDRLSTTNRVMPWESDLVSQAATNLRSVYRYRKYKDRFGHTHRPKTPFLSSMEPDGSYGGCGTFFGLTKDPVKRACVLEKYIANHQPKCDSGKQKSSTKLNWPPSQEQPRSLKEHPPTSTTNKPSTTRSKPPKGQHRRALMSFPWPRSDWLLFSFCTQ